NAQEFPIFSFSKFTGGCRLMTARQCKAASGHFRRWGRRRRREPIPPTRSERGIRACTHKIASGDSDLINVRFGILCGLKSDISRGPRSADVLQKSPRRSSRIKIRNDRIGANRFLNQPCALIPTLNQSCALGCANSLCNTICQTWTSATLHSITSSARASRGRRHIEAERPGGLEVDDQLEPRRLYDGQICGLRAVENPAGVGANLP